VSLESPFWDALGEIARQRRTSLSRLVTSIDLRREHYNLSSAIRLFVFDCHRRPEPEPATVLLKASHTKASYLVVCPVRGAFGEGDLGGFRCGHPAHSRIGADELGSADNASGALTGAVAAGGADCEFTLKRLGRTRVWAVL
jgi:hypothetical protein